MDTMKMYKRVLFVLPENKDIRRGGNTTKNPKNKNVGPRNLNIFRAMFIYIYYRSSQKPLYLYRRSTDGRLL